MAAQDIDFNKWKTPNTYGTNYQDIPDKSGVYILVCHQYTWVESHARQSSEILYIGSAKSLKVRYARHEVKRMLLQFYDSITFYFKEVENYREVEKNMIKKHQPKYNIQWR